MADKAKKSASTKKTVKNTSEQAYALPNGTYLPPGEEVVVSDWESQAENETVQEWIENGHLEVSDAPPEPDPAAAAPYPDPPEPDQSPSKKSESDSRGSQSSSSGSAQTSKPKSQER